MRRRVWVRLWAVGCQHSGLAREGGECGERRSYLVHHADDESFLLDLVGLDRVLILQDFAYRLVNEMCAPEMATEVSQTGVDQLLQLRLPSFLLGDLLLDRGDLCWVMVSFAGARSHQRGLRVRLVRVQRRGLEPRRVLAYQIRGLAFDDELLLLEVLPNMATCQWESAK